MADEKKKLAELLDEFRQVIDEVRELRVAFDALRRGMPPALATMEQAAEALGVSLSTIRRRVRDGSLPCKRLGRAVRVDLAAVRPADAGEIAELARRAREG
jgi:excisionase family DNA binding protein